MDGSTRDKGKEAEQIALNFLLKRGYDLVEQNYTTRNGEIDLIMRNHEYIVFVEVKSLQRDSRFCLYESITKKKKRRLSKAINSWLAKNDLQDSVWRADLVTVSLDFSKNLHKIEHFEFLDIPTR